MALTLVVDYGDGNGDVFSIPQGSGTDTIGVWHMFGGPVYDQSYTQQFTISQTGSSTQTTTLHGNGP
ncbi:MAG: hypothetical protein M3065_00600 [Actinomycetota bacterium]|nr:hypothetical protein [Actinomycetota bacterium]